MQEGFSRFHHHVNHVL